MLNFPLISFQIFPFSTFSPHLNQKLLLHGIRDFFEHSSSESLPEWLREYPVTIIQFVFFLYHHLKDLMPVFMSGDVLNALASTLFPRCNPDSKSSTPEDVSLA